MGRKRENPEEKKTPGTHANRTWLVSYVASAGLEPTPGGTSSPSISQGPNGRGPSPTKGGGGMDLKTAVK